MIKQEHNKENRVDLELKDPLQRILMKESLRKKRERNILIPLMFRLKLTVRYQCQNYGKLFKIPELFISSE